MFSRHGQIRPHALRAFASSECYDALGRAGLVRHKQVTIGDCLDASIERVEARNRVSGQRDFEAFVCEACSQSQINRMLEP